MTDEENKLGQEVPFFGVDKRHVKVTPAMCETWQSGVRALFAQVVKAHGGDVAAAWAAVFSEIRRLHPDVGPDDREWPLPILRGQRNITLDEGRRMLERFRDRTPLLDGLAAALGQERQG